MKDIQKWATQIVELVVYSNVWIALAALAMTCQTYIQIQQPITLDALLPLVFSATLFTYTLARLLTLRHMSTESKSKYWFGRQEYWLRWLFVGAMVIGGISFLFIAQALQILLLIAGGITLLYSLPIIPYQGQYIRLRDVNFSKIFQITLTWGFSTALLPILNTSLSFEFNHGLIIVERMLFIFILTLPFDIRDIQYDTKRKLRTIPNQIGVKATIQLVYGCFLLILCILTYLFLQDYYTISLYISLLFSYLITILIVRKSVSYQPDLFYTGLLDGLMIVQFLIVLCFVWKKT